MGRSPRHWFFLVVLTLVLGFPSVIVASSTSSGPKNPAPETTDNGAQTTARTNGAQTTAGGGRATGGTTVGRSTQTTTTGRGSHYYANDPRDDYATYRNAYYARNTYYAADPTPTANDDVEQDIAYLQGNMSGHDLRLTSLESVTTAHASTLLLAMANISLQQVMVFEVASEVTANAQAIRQCVNNMTVWDEFRNVYAEVDDNAGAVRDLAAARRTDSDVLNASVLAIAELQNTTNVLTSNVSALGRGHSQLRSRVDTTFERLGAVDDELLDIGMEAGFLNGNMSSHNVRIAGLESGAVAHSATLDHVEGNVTLLQQQVSEAATEVSANALAIRRIRNNMSVWEEFNTVYAAVDDNSAKLAYIETGQARISNLVNVSQLDISDLASNAAALNISVAAFASGLAEAETHIDTIAHELNTLGDGVANISVELEYVGNRTQCPHIVCGVCHRDTRIVAGAHSGQCDCAASATGRRYGGCASKWSGSRRLTRKLLGA